MDDEKNSGKKRGNLIWLLVLLLVIFLWWYLRPSPKIDASATTAQINADRVSAYAGGRVEPGVILVDLRDDIGNAGVAKVAHAVGVQLEPISSQSYHERLYRAHVPVSREAKILAELEARPDVEAAGPDAILTLPPQKGYAAPKQNPKWEGFPNDPKYKYQWHLRQIDMPGAWKLADGAGITVAVIDTGVDYENYGRFHRMPDLAGVEFVKPYNFVNNTTHADDDHGHGTHVTGTIAQATHNGIGVAGIARKVKIMPLKVLSASGSGSVGAIADAIRYAADNGAQVINMSLGGRFPSRVLERAVKYAHDHGVVVVCAAGNEGRGKVGYPAAFPGAIAVAATQYDESTTFYSNWGDALDIAAPGGNTRVDQNGDGMPDGVLQNTIAIGDPSHDDYYAFMGTSMASPHVAGVAALVEGEGVTNPDEVETILKETARPPKGQKFDKKHYGAGILDAQAAVRKARTHDGGWELLLGLLIAGAVASSVRRRPGLGVKLGPSYLVGVLVGASGLFFLPYLSATASSWPVVETLTHGLPSWDLSIFGPVGHGNPLFFSALIPLSLMAIGYGVKRLRGLLAGVAIGVAANLLFHAAVPTTAIHWIPTALLDELWLAVNAAIAVGIAHVALRR